MIYKLHPIEQTAFSGRKFSLGPDCYELTDELLFEKDMRYSDLLNAFDVMVSDYSSIAYDYLLLNRPIVYLIPDYEEYISERGFVFRNVELFMPGEKVLCFSHLLSALEEAFYHPGKYERERVLAYRFDFQDDQSARRCYETIISYREPEEDRDGTEKPPLLSYPSSAELLRSYVPKEYEMIDSTKPVPKEQSVEEVSKNTSHKYLYITEEIPGKLRKIMGRSSTEIEDIAYYYQIKECANVTVCGITGGVDYPMFSSGSCGAAHREGRRRIGFAGVIDKRIYFAMVQCICEVFSDCDVIFAGEIFGTFPTWLHGFDNLRYIPVSYEELPSMIQTFDVGILPFFGRHADTIPKEYFQYLACGKQVVASDMRYLPDCPALYRSASVEEAVQNMKLALTRTEDIKIQECARSLAADYDWKNCARNSCIYNRMEAKSIHAHRRTVSSKLKCNGVPTTVAASLMGHTPEVNEHNYTYNVSDQLFKFEKVAEINRETKSI